MYTVLWDLDGTITDSQDAHFRAWRDSLALHGAAYSYEDFVDGFGRSNSQLLPELLEVDAGAPIVQQISHEKEAAFREIARNGGLAALPGVVKWLERFRNEGVKQVICSSAPMANIAASVDILDIADYFSAMLSGAALPRSKPDPEIFFNSALAVKAAPRECLVIEDSLHGVEGAQRAGMGCVAVGRVANSVSLAEYLDARPEFACIAATTMEDVTWTACLELWRRMAKE